MQLSVDIDRMIKEENAKKFISKISRDRKSREAREYLRKANEISIEMKDISENRPNYIKSVARKKLEKKLLEDHKHLDDYFVLNKYSKYHEYNKILNQRNIEKLDKKLDRKLERLEESKFHDVEAIKRDKIQYLKQKYLVQ